MTKSVKLEGINSLLQLTVIIIIVDDDWSWFLEGNVMSSQSSEDWASLGGGDIVEVDDDGCVTGRRVDSLERRRALKLCSFEQCLRLHLP